MKKGTVIIMQIIIYTILTSSSICTNGFAPTSKPVVEYPSEVLPSLMITFSYLIHGYGEKDNYINTKYQSLKKQLNFLSKLDANFEKIPAIYNSLVFSNLTFIVQNNIPG
jgi:hypothetical protein